jgi:hypothetical protein
MKNILFFVFIMICGVSYGQNYEKIDTSNDYAIGVYISNIIKEEVIGKFYMYTPKDSVFLWGLITTERIISTEEIKKSYPQLYNGFVYNYFRERDLINKILDNYRKCGDLFLPDEED